MKIINTIGNNLKRAALLLTVAGVAVLGNGVLAQDRGLRQQTATAQPSKPSASVSAQGACCQAKAPATSAAKDGSAEKTACCASNAPTSLEKTACCAQKAVARN